MMLHFFFFFLFLLLRDKEHFVALPGTDRLFIFAVTAFFALMLLGGVFAERHVHDGPGFYQLALVEFGLD